MKVDDNMKCVKIVDEKKFEVTNMDSPVSKNDRVVFKVNTCGICGSDIHYWVSGNPKGLVMGHEFSGTVINPGSRKDLKIGDRITGLPISPCGKCEACKTGNPQYCLDTWTNAVGLSLDNSGGYAEISSCQPNMVRKLSNKITDNEGAMIEPSSVSLHAVNLANVKVGDNVLIIGAGIIGLMSAEFAKLSGAKNIVLLETNEKRGKKSLTYGAVTEYYNALDDKTIPKLKEKYNGFDKIIECCGNSAAVSEAMMLCKNGGTIVLVGVSLTPITIPMVVSVLGEVKLQGAIGYTEFEFDQVMDLIANDKLDVEKYIDDIVPLEKVQESFERLTSGTDDAIKIIIKP